jgi:hypothetical protein
MNMESQLKTQNQQPASQTGSVVFVALFRLALLVMPEVTIFKTMSQSPVLSLLAAIVVLAVWLSVDVWPFRAITTAPVMVPALARPARVVHSERLAKAQRWNGIMCRVLIFCVLLHSKFTI